MSIEDAGRQLQINLAGIGQLDLDISAQPNQLGTLLPEDSAAKKFTDAVYTVYDHFSSSLPETINRTGVSRKIADGLSLTIFPPLIGRMGNRLNIYAQPYSTDSSQADKNCKIEIWAIDRVGVPCIGIANSTPGDKYYGYLEDPKQQELIFNALVGLISGKKVNWHS